MCRPAIREIRQETDHHQVKKVVLGGGICDFTIVTERCGLWLLGTHPVHERSDLCAGREGENG